MRLNNMEGLRPKLIIGTTTVIVILILLSLTQEMNRRWQVQEEVSKLESNVKDLEKNVIELEQLNQYFRSDDYQERLAREQLNYKAEGEKVVLIPEKDLVETPSSQVIESDEEHVSLPLRWWKAFFVDEIPQI